MNEDSVDSNNLHLVERSDCPPHVLIYDPDARDGLALASRLRRSRCDVKIEVPNARTPFASCDAIDVAFVNVAGGSCDGLAFAAELTVHWPWVEIVFWYREDRGFPGAAVGRSLGITRMVPQSQLEAWAELAFAKLVEMARTRRAHLAAEKALPPIPRFEEPATIMRLPEAERQFREIYLRRILAESDSYTGAARKAGVPYTTFRSMLEKLDIS